MKSNALRESARGEVCTLQIVGICNGDTETTVLAHLPDESKGMGHKSDDISVCYSCMRCHDAIDRRSNSLSESDREFYMRRAMVRTLRRMIKTGLIQIRGLK